MSDPRPLVVHVIAGLGDGGAEATLRRVCTAERSYRHHVVSLTDLGRQGADLRAAGVPVTALGMRRGRLQVGALWRLWRLMRRLRPEVVQTWMYHADLIGGIVARAAGVRHVVWNIRHAQLDPAATRLGTMRVARLCARLSRRVPARIVCCAHAAMRAHVALGYDGTRMAVVANGYDPAGFAPDPSATAAFRVGLGRPEGTALVGMVARFAADKDHATLLSALASLRAQGRAVHAVLAGTGMDAGNTSLSGLLRRHGLADSVVLLGPRRDVATVMAALDVHVLSSRSEGFPNVVAEAMLCGTPCVVTDAGDAARIVGDTGWVVPPADPRALAGALADALDSSRDPEGWAHRRRAAASRIRTVYSFAAMLDAYRAIWTERRTG